ncbi:MAG TPA: winged helix-turn-helix domain-containing protein, partial [Vicinamibacteria bacterium]|nr:winged helix-turn-helix domain-containing protein [Vicinamibacteria bacterium]
MDPQIWRFGAFELDGSRGELRKEGRRVRLKPQPLMVLVALLEKRGCMVTRDELKERLWAEAPAYRTDENLNHAVKRLREALGDSGNNPRFVATIRHNGYRFLADVSAAEVANHLAERRGTAREDRHRGRVKAYAAGVAGALIIAMLLALALLDRQDSVDTAAASVIRATLPLEGELRLGRAPGLALSPDGRTVVYAARRTLNDMNLYIQELASETARIVPGTRGAGLPFFSLDGAKVGFFSTGERRLMQVATDGGVPTSFGNHEFDELPFGATWTPEGDVVLATSSTSGLVRLTPDGGREPLTVPDREKREKGHRLPDALPNGKAILFTVGTVDITSFDDASVAVVDLESRDTKILIEGGTCGRYSPSGHIVYWREGSLYAVPFDQDWLRVTGPPRPVQENVMAPPYAAAPFAIARNGTLVFAPGPLWFRTGHLALVDRKGRAEPIATGLPASGEIANVSSSPRGDRVAFSVGGATDHIWVHDFERHSASRLTFAWDNLFPTWAPDGRRLAFWSNRGGGNGIFVKDVDTSSEPEVLVSSSHTIWPTSWSFDGRLLLFEEHRDGRDWDLRVIDFENERRAETWLSTPFNEGWGFFSPDARWVAYESDESGRFEIYVRAYETPETKRQVSTRGGIRPRWAPN